MQTVAIVTWNKFKDNFSLVCILSAVIRHFLRKYILCFVSASWNLTKIFCDKWVACEIECRVEKCCDEFCAFRACEFYGKQSPKWKRNRKTCLHFACFRFAVACHFRIFAWLTQFTFRCSIRRFFISITIPLISAGIQNVADQHNNFSPDRSECEHGTNYQFTVSVYTSVGRPTTASATTRTTNCNQRSIAIVASGCRRKCHSWVGIATRIAKIVTILQRSTDGCLFGQRLLVDGQRVASVWTRGWPNSTRTSFENIQKCWFRAKKIENVISNWTMRHVRNCTSSSYPITKSSRCYYNV